MNRKIGRNEKNASQDRSDRYREGNLQFRIFAILWAVAMLFHMAHSSIFDTQLNLALLTLAAIYVMLRPSIASFTILISLQIFDACFRMPFTTNHWIFAAFANVTIIQVLLFLTITGRSFKISESELFRYFAPIIRIELIILYFFAVFHKLNGGFFSPDTSCATDLLRAQNIDQIVPLNASLYTLNAYVTLATEASIPLLLCFRRTRNIAVLIGLFFHCVLSYSTYNAFYDFSALMFACYFLFINPAFSKMLHQTSARVTQIKESISNKFSAVRLLAVALSALFVLALIYVLNKKIDTYQTVHLYFFWTVYSILFTGCFIGYIVHRKQKNGTEKLFGVAHWSFVTIPLLVFLNGTSPYLGLKTENSFAMFSNLRTEGGKTNHFIVPASIQLFDFQKDVVEIISSTDPGLREFAENKRAMVLFEFRNYVNERRPESVKYVLHGKNYHFQKNDHASSEALGKNPYVIKKLMKFRSFSPQEPQPCAH